MFLHLLHFENAHRMGYMNNLYSLTTDFVLRMNTSEMNGCRTDSRTRYRI